MGAAEPTGGDAIALEAVSRIYGDGPGQVRAVDGVSLAIRQNEFFTLLGPSGCGKTTLLRMIAGFDQASSGRILLGGRDVGGLPPFKRPVNTVFQSYALFPHMTVAQNVGFGLEMLGRPKTEIDARVAEMLQPGAHGGARQPRHQPDLRRAAAARGAGPRPGPASRGAPARRAAVGTGSQAAQGDADRAQAAPARHRHHLRLRHARPGGGADHVRPDRGDEPGHRCARSAARARSTIIRPSASSPTSSARPTCSRANWSRRGRRPAWSGWRPGSRSRPACLKVPRAGPGHGRGPSGACGATRQQRPRLAGHAGQCGLVGSDTQYHLRLASGDRSWCAARTPVPTRRIRGRATGLCVLLGEHSVQVLRD